MKPWIFVVAGGVWFGLTVLTWIVRRASARRPALSRKAGLISEPARRRTLKRPFLRRWTALSGVVVDRPPHAFSHRGEVRGTYWDLSQNGQPELLARWKLPLLHTPDDIAVWLGVPVNRLAWLAHRCRHGRPDGVKQAHYHFRWLPKRSGGLRLIEAPKRELRAIQHKILREILDRVPVPAAAHGFVRGRSIKSNAAIHAGSAIILKLDLRNFYAAVSFSRVVAIFRAMGYSREAALWLARLTTSAMPGNLAPPAEDPMAAWAYRRRHLPQGAATSPALANLSAYWLDKRLTGLAKAFGVRYTRYADDLTFSGDESFDPPLRVVIQLAQQVIREERFSVQKQKRRILRRNQRQVVTGVVVNDRPNVCRRDVDRLKAVLHNCVVHGPSTQNRDRHPQFAAHLRGRIAHVSMLNPARGAKLMALFQRINWTR